MEIQELIIKKYGKFSDYHMTFRPGVNIIYGGNETGKTTIHSFIKAMMFGLSRGRGRAARTDEYQLRQPWDSPGSFLGSMRIRENGELYRIDRSFDRSGSPLTLVCETSALVSEHPQEDLDTLLGGISETAFVNSVFIPQMHCETDEALAQELQRYMINSGSSMDGNIDVTRALQSLRKKKKQLEQQAKKEEEELERKIAQKQEKLDSLRRELEFLEQQAAYCGAEPADGERTGAGGRGGRDPGYRTGWDGEPDLGRSDDEPGREKGTGSLWMRRLLCAMLVLAGALTMAGAFLTGSPALRTFLGVLTALFWAAAFGVHALFAQEDQEGPHGSADGDERGSGTSGARTREQPGCPPELLKEIKSRRETAGKLENELEILYGQHARMTDPSVRAMELSGRQTGDPSAFGAASAGRDPAGKPAGGLGEAGMVPDIYMEIEALTLAIDRICELSDRIYQANGNRLNEIASQILEEITCGRYNRIVMDDAAEVRIHTPSRVLGLTQVSSGTMQQIYFALRMAAGEVFAESRDAGNRADARYPAHSSLPVILDETFAMYDDHRLEATLKWLKKSGRQVILFTCQSREREILKRL
ncbi:MAG: AAA family ATPase [Clostridiales bacterium]|nr:AAA family ATPase [Clostridiales bacterium]